MLATLQLDPARTEFLSKFIDTYLRFEADEEQRFQAEIDRLETGEREAIMQTLTSWEEKGLVRGRQEGEVAIVLQQLNYKFDKLSPEVEAQIHSLTSVQIEELCKALLEFKRVDDLISWLQNLEISQT